MRGTVVCSAVCLLLLTFCSGCLESDKIHVETMTMYELVGDFNQDVDNDTKTITYWFGSLDDGDTLIIQDIIYDLIYQSDDNISRIAFSSLPNTSYSLSFEGDITTKFRKNDQVEIKIHIIEVTFTEQNPYTNETWTFITETFEEGFDMEAHDSIPFPQAVISLY